MNSGRVYCWGSNQSGVLGAGTTGGFETTPVRTQWPPPIVVNDLN